MLILLQTVKTLVLCLYCLGNGIPYKCCKNSQTGLESFEYSAFSANKLLKHESTAWIKSWHSYFTLLMHTYETKIASMVPTAMTMGCWVIPKFRSFSSRLSQFGSKSAWLYQIKICDTNDKLIQIVIEKLLNYTRKFSFFKVWKILWEHSLLSIHLHLSWKVYSIP